MPTQENTPPHKEPSPQDPPGQAPSEAPQEYELQAEMRQLLHVIVHSLYTQPEIFLRELISNAADALNRLRFLQQTHHDLRDAEAELAIQLELNAKERVLTLEDNGIGMTKEELIQNLGTIAHSGTLEFLRRLSGANPETRETLIGQFGVGFYAVFMVARSVTVDTCAADRAAPATRWRSTGDGRYTLEPSTRTRRGSLITVELREEHEQFAQAARIEEIVQRHSGFIPFPIRMQGRRLNTQAALWSFPRSTVTAEQYEEFYRTLSSSTEAPLHTMHFSVDAPVQYHALLFIPPSLPQEVLYNPQALGLQLYANKVLIQREFQGLLPPYLRFLCGVVDSADLPLNISRENPQHGPLLARLRTTLGGQVLRNLETLASEKPERYERFWSHYGKVLKEGLAGEENTHRERLLKLLRVHSTASDDLTSLHDYIVRMPEGQKEIYWFSGAPREMLARSPLLEHFRRRNYEVLLLSDEVDDFVMARLNSFEDKPLASIERSDLAALHDESPKAETEADRPTDEAPWRALLDFLRETLLPRVRDVRLSKRLVESPALLSTDSDEPSPHLQKLLQRLNENYEPTPRVLEINPEHPLIQDLAALQREKREATTLRTLAELLLDQCLIAEGALEQPEQLRTRLLALMHRAASAARVASVAPAQDEAS